MKNLLTGTFLLLVAWCASSASGYNILVYSAQISHSHVSFMGHIADTLVNAGHNVTVFIPEFVENVTSVGTKLARTVLRRRQFAMPSDRHKEVHERFWEADAESPLAVVKTVSTMADLILMLCKQQLSDKAMIEQMKTEKFDLGIGELFDPCSIAYMHAIGVPAYISAFSMNIMELMSQPFAIDNNPSYVPGTFSPLSDEMSYLERLQNALLSLVSRLIYLFVLHTKFDRMLHGCLGEHFDLTEKIARSSFLFVNSDEFTEFPRPINHKVVFVGGVAVQPPQPLSKDFQVIMDSSVDGVVFISFGSVMKSSEMPSWMKRVFLDTFRNFPKITFIWKYEVEDEFGKDVMNVIKVKWAPQNDLLGHPKLKAFVTHAGLNSITEATHAGVPVITIPLFGDQMRNSKMVEKRGVGYVLSKHNISLESLSDALRAVVYGSSYWKAAQRLSSMIRSKPASAKERVVRYAEFAAEFGHIDNLDPAALKLNIVQYYLLDIIVPAILVLLLSSFLCVKILLFLLKRLRGTVKDKRE